MFFSQPSFSSGEISPALYGRVDQELYYIAARIARNMLVKREGGVMNRPGSYLVSESIDSSNKTKLIPFQFNETQTYCLEFTDQHMRVVTNGGEVLETAATFNITDITQSDPGFLHIPGHTFAVGDDIYVQGIVGMVELNARTLRVSMVITDYVALEDFQGVPVDTTNYGAYTGGGTAARIYTVATPWLAPDLFDLNYAQSADVITIVHQKYPVMDITRSANDAFTISDFSPADGPFKDSNVDDTLTVTASATTGSIVLSAGAPTFNIDDVGTLFYIVQDSMDATPMWQVAVGTSTNAINRAGYNYYRALNSATTGNIEPTHLDGSATDGTNGVTWEYLHSGYGIVKITGFTDSQHVTADVIKYIPDNLLTIPSSNWSKAAWSKDQGYPGAVSYHKGRFWFGGTPQQPNTIWCSNSDLRAEFGVSTPVLDDDSITITLDTTQVNAIRHLVPMKVLIALTSATSQSINGTNNNILATSPPVASAEESYGSSKVRPITIGNTTIYVEDTGDVVRSAQYDLSTDSYTGIDLTARSSHLFKNRQIVDWAYQKRPEGIVWTVMSGPNKYDAGTLLAFTYMQEQKVMAWSRCDTMGEYESVCCIREGNVYSAYKMVARTVNGTLRRYLEVDAQRDWTDIVDAYFVDCGLTYDGRNTSDTTITVSGGTIWDNPEVLNLAASAPIFVPKDIGNQIVFIQVADPIAGTAEIRYRLTINAYIDGEHATAVPTKALPPAYQNVARADWNFARLKFGPFYHLEGQPAAVLSDGNVVEGLTFENGALTLDTPGIVVHGGLPYSAELETLDFAQPQGQGKSKVLNIDRLYLTVEESRSVFVATSQYGNLSRDTNTDIKNRLMKDKFVEIKSLLRTPSMGYDAPIPTQTSVFEVTTNTSWSRSGRICIRAPYPLPITINCITFDAPAGYA